MKKIVFIFLAAALCAVPAAFAKEGFVDKIGRGMVHKLGRGVEGIITAPWEYMNQGLIMSEKERPIPATIGTIVVGTTMTGKRLINGAYDIATFPVSLPFKYKVLLPDDAETALDNYKQLNNIR